MRTTFIIFAFVIISMAVHSQNQSKQDINLTSFNISEIPDSLLGCSCLFSNSKEEYLSDKFIYFNDFGDNAFIFVDNKIVMLKKQDEDIYENESYTVYIKNKKQADTGYEADEYEAELVISDKQGNKKTYKIYGVCGC